MDGPLAQAWEAAETAMPESWRLDSLRCASTGLSPEERSERWVAVAAGPDDEELTSEAATPEAALDGLRVRIERRSRREDVNHEVPFSS